MKPVFINCFRVQQQQLFYQQIKQQPVKFRFKLCVLLFYHPCVASQHKQTHLYYIKTSILTYKTHTFKKCTPSYTHTHNVCCCCYNNCCCICVLLHVDVVAKEVYKLLVNPPPTPHLELYSDGSSWLTARGVCCMMLFSDFLRSFIIYNTPNTNT